MFSSLIESKTLEQNVSHCSDVSVSSIIWRYQEKRNAGLNLLPSESRVETVGAGVDLRFLAFLAFLAFLVNRGFGFLRLARLFLVEERAPAAEGTVRALAVREVSPKVDTAIAGSARRGPAVWGEEQKLRIGSASFQATGLAERALESLENPAGSGGAAGLAVALRPVSSPVSGSTAVETSGKVAGETLAFTGFLHTGDKVAQKVATLWTFTLRTTHECTNLTR